MVRRFSVSCSDELGNSLDRYKEKLSPSAIFQSAAEVAVEREERLSKELNKDVDMDAIVERLRQEKKETTKGIYEQGRKDGMRWAKSAHYDDLVSVVKFEPPYEDGQMLDFSGDDNDCIADILKDFFEEYPQYNTQEDDAGYLHDEAVEYVTGYLEGVGDFWKEVESKL